MKEDNYIDGEIRLSSFENSIRNAERFVKSFSKSDYKKINYSLGRIYNYIQKKKKENPDLSRSDLIDFLYDYNNRLSQAAFTNSTVLNYVTAFNACNYLSKHPKKLKEINEHIKTEHISSKNDFFIHGQTFKENLINFVSFINHMYPEALEYYNARLPKTLLSIIVDNRLSIAEREKKANSYCSLFPLHQRAGLMEATKLNLYGVPEYLKVYSRYAEDELRCCLIDSTIEIVSLLDELDYFDNWIKSENQQFKKIGIPEINITPELLKKQLSKVSLNSLSTTDLLGINIMYVNRLFHIIEDHSRADFAIEEFNLEPLLIDSSKPPVVNEKDLEPMLIKMNLFYFPTENYYNENDRIISELNKAGKISADKSVSYSLDPLISELRKLYSEKYLNYFSDLLPGSQNDIGRDLRRYSSLANTIHLLKDTKTQNSLALISLFALYGEKTNYGIVLDSVADDGTYGETRHFVDFMADINSISPLNIHMRTETIRDFIKDYLDTSIIPIYSGSEDWELEDNTTMKSHIMMPWNKPMKKTVKQLSKSDKIIKKSAVQHLRVLSDEKAHNMHKKTYFNFDSNSILEKVGDIYVQVVPNKGEDNRNDR